jgi:hypothetical protein
LKTKQSRNILNPDIQTASRCFPQCSPRSAHSSFLPSSSASTKLFLRCHNLFLLVLSKASPFPMIPLVIRSRVRTPIDVAQSGLWPLYILELACSQPSRTVEVSVEVSGVFKRSGVALYALPGCGGTKGSNALGSDVRRRGSYIKG